MCLENKNHIQLGRCPHGAYQLRVGNTTLHLTQQQVLDLHAEMNRCVKTKTHTDTQPQTPQNHSSRFGPNWN